MEPDLDTFLTTVYVMIDELYQTQYAPHKPTRPGPAPTVSDSEVLTLGLVAQWQRSRSERERCSSSLRRRNSRCLEPLRFGKWVGDRSRRRVR